MTNMPITKAKLQRGVARLGWTPWWLVDENGNPLNTEPVCTTPEDKWHPWFIKKLEEMELPYWGVRESPPNVPLDVLSAVGEQ